MKTLYLWQQPNWRNFPSKMLTADDACVLIGNGVLAIVEKLSLPCSLFVLTEDRIFTAAATVIDHAQWLQLIIAYDKVVSL